MTTPNGFRDAEYIADISDIPNESDEDAASTNDRRELAPQGLRGKAQTTAKIAYIDRLLRDLDIMTYCELSALYYMEFVFLPTYTIPPLSSAVSLCSSVGQVTNMANRISCRGSCSLILFATRAIVQLILFTPKVPPFAPTRNQPHIGAIFSSNLFCMLLHVLFVHPGAGEETRGYLHGGLFIDFVGQKAPVSRVHLLAFDVLVMTLNLVMLGLVLERVKTKSAFYSSPSTTTEPILPQDHDSEERGMLRNTLEAAVVEPTADGIELQELGRGPGVNRDSSSQWRLGLLAEPSGVGPGQVSRDSHALDAFVSGQAVIMDMGIIDTIRDQWCYEPSTMSTRAQPSNETAAFLRERFGIEVGPDGGFIRADR
jgi:Fungal domain of unknown function (DUF1746)